MSSISNDLVERTNKLFERIKDDPEFQYFDDDFETKDLITSIEKGEDDPESPGDLQLIFHTTKIKIIKNLNITPNLVAYPYFLDFLPMKMIQNEIKYIVNDKYITRDEINMMLFEKESINNNKNIKFVFPRNCIVNIPNKLYIHEFAREIIHLTIHYIHSKMIDLLINNTIYYDKVINTLENIMAPEPEKIESKETPEPEKIESKETPEPVNNIIKEEKVKKPRKVTKKKE